MVAISSSDSNQYYKQSMESDGGLKEELNNLESEIGELRKLVNKLIKLANFSPNYDKQKQNLNKKNSGKKEKLKNKICIDYSAPENVGKCQYHILYGDNAFHCILPCIDSGKPLASRINKIQKSNSDNNQENFQGNQ